MSQTTRIPAAMRLGCHLWSFRGCTVAEAAAITRALGLSCLDLGNGRDLDPLYVAAHPAAEADRLTRVAEQAGITFVDCFPQVNEDGLPYTNNHPDPAVRARYRALWQRFFPFAAAIGLSGVTLSPGRFWDGEAPQADFDRAAQELRWAVEEGSRCGLAIRIEPHIESVTWRPELVLAMLEAVPGLTLTLDHAHFIFHGLPYAQIAVLHPYATHWHARQARAGQAQSRGPTGRIDFARIVGELRERRYGGVMCLEYVHGAWLQQDMVDCLSETVALRDELQGYLRAETLADQV